MSKKDDGLAADAALAVEHTPEREAEQLSYFGGDADEIDDFDATGLDDGSDPNFVAPDDDDDGESSDDDDGSVEAEESSDDDAEEDAAEDDAEADADAEEEDADDADAEEGDTDEDEADSKPAAKGIPKRRFDEVNEEKKTLREENARLKAQIEAGKPPEDEEEPFDVREGEKAYMNLLLDGDTDAALAKREEIDAAKEAKWRADSKTEVKSELSTDAQQTELLALSGEAERMFDVFDPDSENYNQDMLNKVLTFMRGYESTGEMTRGDAFVAGLADVVEMYDLMPEEEAAAEEADDGKPKPTGKKKVDKKKAKLAKEAHVPVAGEGAASADSGAVVPDIETMTDEEIDALPEKTLARLRGDFV